MKFTFLLVLLLLGTQFSFAQDMGCDGSRYIDLTFTSTTAHEGINFGENVTLGGNNYELLMDIYEPEGDDVEQRPLVILAHGGAFISGSRADFAATCETLASRGYVAATIEYRLIDALVFDSIAFTEAVVMAVHDMKAAIRYFREDAATTNTYKINPDMIFVGGASAGAVTAVHTAYLDEEDTIPDYIQGHLDDNGGFEGSSSDNTIYTSEVQGVLNYSGSILRLDWINEGEAPIYSAHDELDGIVPCDYEDSEAFFFPLFSYGSCVITPHAEELGIKNEFFFVEGSQGHVSYFLNANLPVVIGESLVFMEEIICDGITATEEPSAALTWQMFPNPSAGELTIKRNDFSSPDLLQIHDAAGRLIEQQLLTENNLSLQLSAGIYYVSMKGQTQKLVILP